jgi:lysophospholipase L1-like esterase
MLSSFLAAPRRRAVGVFIAVAAAIGACVVPAAALAKPKPPPPPAAAQADIWAATWEASPEPPRGAKVALSNRTVRTVAHVSLGGIFIRVRLSNEFGDKPLVIGAAHVALASGPDAAAQPGTDQPALFGGRPGITIPVGAHVFSDPVRMTVPAMSDVAVSVYFPEQVEGEVTSHYFAMQPAFVAPGDQTSAPTLAGATPNENALVVLTGLAVSASRSTKVAVALGDAVTCGYGSTMGANRRWPDLLAARLVDRKDGPPIGVVNACIGGNRLLHDFFGPNALARFDRDVLSQPAVGYLIVLLGIDDFGLPGGRGMPEEEVSADDVIAGYRQIIERAHTHGIKVFLATIPPFGPIPGRPGFYSDASEGKRNAVNQWMRANVKQYEGLIDFDQALRDSKTRIRLAPQFDSGDHLDPNDAGYGAMVNAIEMRLFE